MPSSDYAQILKTVIRRGVSPTALGIWGGPGESTEIYHAESLVLKTTEDGIEVQAADTTPVAVLSKDGVELYHAESLVLKTIDGGIAAVKPDDADGLIRIVDSEGNVRAEIGSRDSNDNLNIRNDVPGGNVVINSRLIDGVATPALRIEPDNALMLFHPPNGPFAGPVLETFSDGVRLFGSTGSSLRTIEPDGGVWFAVTSSGGLSINQADANGDFEAIWIAGDRNGSVYLRHNNVEKLRTVSNGIELRSTGDVRLALIADTDNSGEDDNPWIFFSQDGGTVTAEIGISGNVNTLPDGTAMTGVGSNSFVVVGLGNIDFVAGGAYQARWHTNGGLVVGAATGGSKGVGTINATAVYDDNALLCMPVEEALDIPTSREKWDSLSPTGRNALVDRHEAHKAEGWDGTADGYVRVMESRGSVPGLATVEEIEAREDRKFSIGERTEQIWLALDYLAVAIRDLTKRIDRLEKGRSSER